MSSVNFVGKLESEYEQTTGQYWKSTKNVEYVFFDVEKKVLEKKSEEKVDSSEYADTSRVVVHHGNVQGDLSYEAKQTGNHWIDDLNAQRVRLDMRGRLDFNVSMRLTSDEQDQADGKAERETKVGWKDGGDGEVDLFHAQLLDQGVIGAAWQGAADAKEYADQSVKSGAFDDGRMDIGVVVA